MTRPNTTGAHQPQGRRAFPPRGSPGRILHRSAQDSASSGVAGVLAAQGFLSLSCPCRAPTRVTPDAPRKPADPYVDPATDHYRAAGASFGPASPPGWSRPSAAGCSAVPRGALGATGYVRDCGADPSRPQLAVIDLAVGTPIARLEPRTR